MVYNYFDKKTGKFINELSDNIPEKEESYRLYLYDFIFRTRRILSSIVLLAIYGKLSDMNILHRPLLENIIQTKVLLKGRRTKSVRAINLYKIINKLKEHKKLIEDFLEQDKKDNNILMGEQECNHLEEIDKLEQELTNYYEDEIHKMDKMIQKGFSWHGRSVKTALKEYNSIDDYEDYNDACKFIHVRDFGLTRLDFCNDNYVKMKLFFIMLSCIFHLEDFKKICPNSFTTKRKNAKKIDCGEILEKLIVRILFTISPRFRKSMEKLKLESLDQINQ